MDSAEPHAGRTRTLRLAGVAVAFALAWGAQCARRPLELPFTLDNQHYYFVAERAASGVPPHVSHFDSKNALSMLISAAAIRSGRALGVPDALAARAVSMLAVALAAAGLWALARAAAGGDALAAWLAVLVLLSHGGFLLMGAMGARPKVFLVPFAVATGLAVSSRRPLWAGAAAAAAFLCWQPALLLLAAAAAPVAVGPRPLRGLALLAAGALAVAAPYHLGFWAAGALPDLVEQTYRFTAVYMSEAPRDLGSNLARLLGAGGGFTPERLWLLGFGLALLALAALGLHRPRRARALLAARPGLHFALLAGVGTLAFTVYDYGTFVDAFFVLPFVALVDGVALAWVVRRIRRPWAFRAAAAAVLVGAALLAWRGPLPARVGPTLADQERLGLEVRRLLDEGHPVWAVGCTHLLAFAHADNYVPEGFFFRGMGSYLRDRAGAGGWRPLRDGRMPDVILISRPFVGSVPEARRWLSAEYRERTPASFAAQGVRVLWRRESGAPASLAK
jgi:hypothetical protein